MMKSHMKIVAALLVLTCSVPAYAAERDLSCSLKFTTKEWSALYMHAQGSGTVTCKNGKSMPITISAKGIGITAGKWAITNGSGEFTHVRKIDDVLGSYAALSVDAGIHKSGTAQVLTKGKVSLAIDGTGDGFDVGVAVSDFKISRKK
jgi:hypothetical protein